MKKKIAIPIEGEILCSHFGHCRQFAMYTVENDQIQSIEMHTPPAHEQGVLPNWIAQMGATDLIVGGVGQKAIQILNAQNVNVTMGAEVKDHKSLVEEFLAGTIKGGHQYCDH